MSLNVIPDAVQEFNSFLSMAQKVQDIRKTETILPINAMSAWCTPGSVKADLSLKSGLVSPGEFDSELSIVLASHTLFKNKDTGQYYKLNYTDFCKNISNIDKQALLWGFWRSTYEYIMKDRMITCRKCGLKQLTSATLDDVLHQDSYYPWDKTDSKGNYISFLEYREKYEIEYGDVVYVFEARLPSIYDNNKIISSIDVVELNKRFEKFGTPYSDADRALLVTDRAGLYEKKDPNKITWSKSEQELKKTLEEFIPTQVLAEYLNKYDDDFDKYKPKFYAKSVCECGNEFNIKVDLEVELSYRKQVEMLGLDPEVITEAINPLYIPESEASLNSNTQMINPFISEEVQTSLDFNTLDIKNMVRNVPSNEEDNSELENSSLTIKE